MFLFVVIFILPCIALAKPTIKLTFTPQDRYMSNQQQIEIHCELIDPKIPSDRAQLWYIDPKTNRRIPISRQVFSKPTADLPDVFSQTINSKRYEYVTINHIRIKNLQMQDSSKYECDCPDCEDPVTKQSKDLYVMKTVKPRWIIDPALPLQENARATIRCVVEDFYPYVDHKIYRNHHEITKDGKATIPNGTFPQKFIWEAAITPGADWHNTELRCAVTEGSIEEQNVPEKLQVLFTARFGKCDEVQHVDSTKEQATIECSFSGNPRPELTWYRLADQKSLTSDAGIRVETIDEHHGKWKSIVTFERDKLLTIPMTTPATTTNAQGESNPTYPTGENYYQQLLNNGFTVKVKVNGAEKLSRSIRIASDANDARSRSTDSSTSINISTCLILFAGLLSLMAMFIVRH